MALERVEGVDSTAISYEAGSGWVAFDPALTSPDEFIAELERMTGFTAEIVSAGRDAADHRMADADAEHADDAAHADMDMPGHGDHDHEHNVEHEAAADTTSQ